MFRGLAVEVHAENRVAQFACECRCVHICEVGDCHVTQVPAWRRSGQFPSEYSYMQRKLVRGCVGAGICRDQSLAVGICAGSCREARWLLPWEYRYMQRTMVGSGLVSEGIYREQSCVVAMFMQVHSENRHLQWACEYRYMQRAVVGTGSVCAEVC